MESSNIPNLFLVGAAKAGTTALYRQLELHPDIFFSDPKEPCFMAYHGEEAYSGMHKHAITDFEKYCDLFSSANQKYKGDASAIYLPLYKIAIRNLQTYTDSDNIKIIILLRDPAERAYSQYVMHVRDLKEELPFNEALDLEATRKKEGFNIDFRYQERGFYYQQVKAYMKAFRHVKVFLYEDLVSKPQEVFNAIFDFLEISRLHGDFSKKYNISGQPRSRTLVRLKNRLLYKQNVFKKMAQLIFPQEVRRRFSRRLNESVNKLNIDKKEKPTEQIDKLRDLYKEDIAKLEKLINRDLSTWKK